MGNALPCLRLHDEVKDTLVPPQIKEEVAGRPAEGRPAENKAEANVQPKQARASTVTFGMIQTNSGGKERASRADRNSGRSRRPSRSITQQDLVSDIRRASRSSLASFVNFVKVPVVLYPLTDQSLEKLPEKIWSRLGSVDQATYPADMLQSCLGGAIVLQVMDGEPDFYPIRENAFKEYKHVSLEQALAKNEELRRFLVEFFGPLSEMPFVRGGMKESAVTMVRLSELRAAQSVWEDNDDDDDSPTEVEAPWGGSQFVPPRSDAFVAVPDFDRLAQGALEKDPQVYIVQVDQSDLPANYMQADSVNADSVKAS